MDRGKSTPVPIFNYRKRPRQAVIADPQDGHSITNKYQGLMPVGGFSNENKSRNNNQGFQRFSALQNAPITERGDQPAQPFQQRKHGSQQGNCQKPLNQSNTGASFSTNRNSFSSINQMGDSLRPMKQQTKGINSLSQQQSVGNFKGGYTNQNKTTYVNQSKVSQPRKFPSATITSGNQRICNTSSGLQFGMEQENNRNQQQSFLPTQAPMLKTYQGHQSNQQNYRNYKQNTQQSYGSAQQQGYQQNLKNNHQNKPFKKVDMPSMFHQERNTSGIRGIPFTGGIPIDNSPARGAVYPGESKVFCNGPQTSDRFQKEKQQNKKQSEKKIDPSLHVMTLHPSSIPHWAKYRDNIHMIFEVFVNLWNQACRVILMTVGQLVQIIKGNHCRNRINLNFGGILWMTDGIIDSAVVRDATDSHREFILRDEQNLLKCVFYEIDRELQKLTRGHWHRCVGTYDIKSGCFKCVSVRPATMEEKNHGQQLAVSTNELLKQMTRHLPEQ